MRLEQDSGSWLQPRAILIVGIVVAAAALRIIPHPRNFAPIGAMALFSGAYFSSKRAAVFVSLVALLAGDVFTSFHSLMFWVYGSFLVSVAIGFWLRGKKSVMRIGAATVVGAVQFFLVTNFAVWFSGIGSYSKTLAGLASCYFRGLPLLGNTMAGDAFYVALLFGGMALAERRFPSLQEPLAVLSGRN